MIFNAFQFAAELPAGRAAFGERKPLIWIRKTAFLVNVSCSRRAGFGEQHGEQGVTPSRCKLYAPEALARYAACILWSRRSPPKRPWL